MASYFHESCFSHSHFKHKPNWKNSYPIKKRCNIQKQDHLRWRSVNQLYLYWLYGLTSYGLFWFALSQTKQMQWNLHITVFHGKTFFIIIYQHHNFLGQVGKLFWEVQKWFWQVEKLFWQGRWENHFSRWENYFVRWENYFGMSGHHPTIPPSPSAQSAQIPE